MPKPDNAYRLAGQQEGILIVAFAVQCFAAGADGGVRLMNTAGRGECHAERHLRHRFGEDRAGGQDRDSAPVTLFVIDVREEIAFDVEDGF